MLHHLPERFVVRVSWGVEQGEPHSVRSAARAMIYGWVFTLSSYLMSR